MDLTKFSRFCFGIFCTSFFHGSPFALEFLCTSLKKGKWEGGDQWESSIHGEWYPRPFPSPKRGTKKQFRFYFSVFCFGIPLHIIDGVEGYFSSPHLALIGPNFGSAGVDWSSPLALIGPKMMCTKNPKQNTANYEFALEFWCTSFFGPIGRRRLWNTVLWLVPPLPTPLLKWCAKKFQSKRGTEILTVSFENLVKSGPTRPWPRQNHGAVWG